jgi:hypothetical protein
MQSKYNMVKTDQGNTDAVGRWKIARVKGTRRTQALPRRSWTPYLWDMHTGVPSTLLFSPTLITEVKTWKRRPFFLE